MEWCGYASQSYLEKFAESIINIKVESININVEDITLVEGEEFKLDAIILPTGSSNKVVIWESSNTDILEIDNEGKITALKEGKAEIIARCEDKEAIIEVTIIKELQNIFNEEIKISANIITGLQAKVKDIKEKIEMEYEVEIYNNKNERLEEESYVGTGSKIIVKNELGQETVKYIVILYGDVNGDGKINSIDLLVLQRHILRIERFDGIYLRAGNILKDGKAPSSLDLLKIQRHILKLEIIEQ